MPVYQHLAAVNTSGFPAARAAWLARRYPLVVIEHVQDQGYLYDAPPAGAKCWGPEPFAPPTAFFEDAAAAAAAQIKALNETVIVLYYANANSGLPWYHLASALGASAHPEWRLHDCGNATARAPQARGGGGACGGGDAMAP